MGRAGVEPATHGFSVRPDAIADNDLRTCLPSGLLPEAKYDPDGITSGSSADAPALLPSAIAIVLETPRNSGVGQRGNH